MTIFLTVASILVVALLFRSILAPRTAAATPAAGAIDAAAFGGLRGIFFATRSTALPAEAGARPVFGAAMEIGFPPGTASIVALADGSAHLYLETGGGIIGAERNERVHLAAIGFVEGAAECVEQGEPCEGTPPLPANREVRFHWLTEEGPRTAAISELELEVGRHPLCALYRRGNDLLEQIRAANTPTATATS